jgi:hypothetical protein
MREIFDWTGAQADYRQYAKDLKIKEVLNFREQHHVVLSPFCFWLLQDQDPLGCGEIIAPPFNHRRPDQTVFEENGVENLLTGSSEANHQYLQNGVIVSMPYCLAPASKVLKEAVLSLRSTVTFSWNSAEDPKFHFGINVPNVTVKKPDLDVYLGLAGFFGYHYHPIDQSIKAYDDVVDLPLLMNRFGAEDMTTVSHLNAVLGKMGFHFHGSSLSTFRGILSYDHAISFGTVRRYPPNLPVESRDARVWKQRPRSSASRRWKSHRLSVSGDIGR